MENSRLISIIIPCYNQAQYLDETLQSVLNQTYSDWECLIINDGSPDNTEEKAKIWEDKDSRFRYFCKDNGGVSSARNYGLAKAKGQFIQFLDSDDLLDKRKLELSLNRLDTSDEKVKLIISHFRMFTDDSSKTTIPFCNLNSQLFNFESVLYQWNETFSIPIHCGFFEASLFKNIRFPENLTAQEDWIVWVKIFKLDVQAIFVAEPLALYRQNPGSRMMTKSIFKDQMLAYEYFKTILTESEFYSLSKVLISRYYREQEVFKNRLNGVKNSKTYQTGLMIKKISKALMLLNFFKKIFPILLKLKSK
jgi:glycosyltransferase involved in cell wall biosynthesis